MRTIALLFHKYPCLEYPVLCSICADILSHAIMPRKYSSLLVRTLQVEACEHGKVDIKKVFGPEAKGIIAHLNTEGQHRSAVQAARHAAKQTAENRHEGHQHAHNHDEHHHEHDHGDHKHEHEHGGHKHEHEHEGHKHHHEAGHAHHDHDHDHSHDHEVWLQQ